jgi:tetratricopeptide (TPR) repeat protein
MDRLATLFQTRGLYSPADKLFHRAVAIAEKRYGPNGAGAAVYLNNLALLLQATNRLGEAEPLYRRALGIDEASYGKDHPRVAIDLNNLARLLQDSNRHGEAEPVMRRALAIFCALEAAIGRSHPSRETVQGNYAGLLTDMGKSETEIAAAIAAVRRDAGLDRS